MVRTSLAGHTYLRAHVGGARKERGSGKNTYGVNGQVFWRLRRNVGGTNQIADRAIGHQRSCEYHALGVMDHSVEEAMCWGAKELGYPEGLRPKQQQVVRHFLLGCDVFVSLPTGSGKSLCYCVLPKVFDYLRSSSARCCYQPSHCTDARPGAGHDRAWG